MMSDDSQMTNLDDIRKYALTLSKEAYTLALRYRYRAGAWSWVYVYTGVISAIFSTFAGASILSGSYEKIAGIASLISAAIISVSTTLSPSKKEQDYKNASSGFNSISNNARLLYEVESIGENLEDLQEKLSELNDQMNELDKSSPRLPQRGKEKAAEKIFGKSP